MASFKDHPPLQTVSAERAGRLLIVRHAECPPSDRDWDELLAAFACEHLDQLRVIVFTNVGPNRPQQMRLASTLARTPGMLHCAVVSDNTSITFLASAIALFMPRLRSFRRNELETAMGYLSLLPLERAAVARYLGSQTQTSRLSSVR